MATIKVGIDFDWGNCYYEGDYPDLKVLGVLEERNVPMKNNPKFIVTYYSVKGKDVFPDRIIEIEV